LRERECLLFLFFFSSFLLTIIYKIMHPAAIFAIILGGAIICYGGYEAIHTLYEWHNDRKEQKEYEEYIRMHTEKGRAMSVTVFQTEDDDDDDEPLAIWKQKRDSISELRRRTTKVCIPIQHYYCSNYIYIYSLKMAWLRPMIEFQIWKGLFLFIGV
jgi:hypothetical protein